MPSIDDVVAQDSISQKLRSRMAGSSAPVAGRRRSFSWRSVGALQPMPWSGTLPALAPAMNAPHSFTIAIASDHAGFAYKQAILAHLRAQGHTVRDFGTYSLEACDYPVFIRPCAEAVARGEYDRGIVLGGSGNGEAIVANKVRGIRCGLVFSEDTARWTRSHNDANCIAIGERTIPLELALRLVDLFLETPFDGAGRHGRRVRLIEPA